MDERQKKKGFKRYSTRAQGDIELTPLLDVARRTKRTLKPVAPQAAFRARLHEGLIMAAQHQHAPRILIEKRDRPKWGWIFSAAAIGSAAGVVAVVLHTRIAHRSAARPEPPPEQRN